MEGSVNPAFSIQDEKISQPDDIPNYVSPDSSNGTSSSNEHHVLVGTDEDHPLKTAHLRRNTTPAVFEISNNEAEFDQMCPEINDTTTRSHDENKRIKKSRLWNKAEGCWNQCILRYRGAAHRIITWVLHLCLFAYFITAVLFWNSQGDCDVGWCDGFGMLVILVILLYFGLLYYLVIKKYYGHTIHKRVLKPINELWSSFIKYSYVRIVAYLLPLAAIVIFLVLDTIGNSERLISCVGMTVILFLGFVFSKYPRQIQWRPVLWGLGIQFVFGLITIRWSVGRNVFQCIGDKVATFLGYANVGAKFVYGDFLISETAVFAFQALSVIYFLSFVIQILYYYGAMQWTVIKLGWFIQITMGTTVCESVNAVASIFLGLSDSPILFKPYLKDLTKSEMHAFMTEGFATVAGTVLAAYIRFGVAPAHLITASVMSAPASLCYSKLFYPETEESKNKAEEMLIEKGDENSVLDAATKGALVATQLVLGIIANIIAFVSFVAFLNGFMSWLGMLVGVEGLTFELILSKVFIPLAWVMGVPWKECETVARLIGLKTIINEFVAYEQLGKLLKANELSQRSEMIATYALCGFSNPGSIGILIGSLVTLAPNQRTVITEVAFRAFLAGSATCFLTACIAGMLMPEDYFPKDSDAKMQFFNATS